MAPPVKVFRKTITPQGKSAGGFELVWLHGWGHDHTSLVRLASLFKKSATNILYDLPGFGQTAMLPRGSGTEKYAEVIIRELQTTNPAKRVIIGHSFGCRVALRIAALNPGLVDGLVLIAAAGLPRKKNLSAKLKGLFIRAIGKAAHISDRVLGTSLKENFRNRFGSRDYKAAGELRATFVATVTENLSAIAGGITTPALLLFGAEDLETPVEIGQRYEAILCHGKLKILNGFGHLNILTDGAHQCQHSILTFLGELEAK